MHVYRGRECNSALPAEPHGICRWCCAGCRHWDFACRFIGALVGSMSRITEFLQVYRLYSQHNPRFYALRIAYGIAFRGLPF